jgi:hypothetical protein
MTVNSWTAWSSTAKWSAEVVCSYANDPEMDHFYGYSDDEYIPDIWSMVPEGWTMHEYTVKPTTLNPRYVGR